jgi:hypothetical protein
VTDRPAARALARRLADVYAGRLLAGDDWPPTGSGSRRPSAASFGVPVHPHHGPRRREGAAPWAGYSDVSLHGMPRHGGSGFPHPHRPRPPVVGLRLARRLARRFREKRGRVMGGLGSGRPGGSGRDTVEACRSLDVNRLHREGCLGPAGRAAGSGPATASGWPGSRCAPRPTGCTSPTACASAAASGRTWRRPSASPACPAASAGAGPTSWPGRGGRRRLRAARRQAPRGGALLPVPPLPPPRPRQPGRGRVGPGAAAGEQDPRAPRRRARHGVAVPGPAEGHVARTYARLRRRAFEAEMLADEAFDGRLERLRARLDGPRRKRSFWR